MALRAANALKAAAIPLTTTSIPSSALSTSTVPTLLRFNPDPQRWDFSPWVNRLEALLTFSESSFELGTGNALTAPRGKLPVVRLQEGSKSEIIPDSLHAYQELVKRGVVRELDVGLSPEEIAKSRAIQSIVEEIFLLLAKEGWIDQYYIARDNVVLSRMPFPIRAAVGYYVWRNMSNRCRLSGLKQRTDAEIDDLRQTGVDALATWVGSNKHILGGNSPTRADAAVFGYVASVYVNPHWFPKLTTAVKAHPNLLTYTEGLRKTWYPNRPSFM
ncbi:hypothetical protein DL93DRAFT_2080874 [Clavulina sp. PMI_390]|nr:hypothetical protein DL93DRAFT_2080874 [Clavulina sp. PMI_390]